MPLLVNISVGSLPGTRGLDSTMVWPLEAKKSRNVFRISATVKAGWLMGGRKKKGVKKRNTKAPQAAL
jgi:lipid-binding SYLF domain-containing protein